MRTVTTITNYYTFDELSKEVQEKALDDYIYKTVDLRNDMFYEDTKNALEYIFPNSELDVRYQLAYCQGDGLEFFGKMNGSDLLEFLKNDLSEDAYNGLLELLKETTFELEPHRWGYYIQSYGYFYNELLASNYEGCYSKALMHEFADLAHDKLSEVCNKWKKDGYKYLYEPNREAMVEEILMNGYEFLEDGTLA